MNAGMNLRDGWKHRHRLSEPEIPEEPPLKRCPECGATKYHEPWCASYEE